MFSSQSSTTAHSLYVHYFVFVVASPSLPKCRCLGGAARHAPKLATPSRCSGARQRSLVFVFASKAHFVLFTTISLPRFRSMWSVLCVAVVAAGSAAVAAAPPPCETVAAGNEFACAIVGGNRTDIYCWGSNDNGQLGDAKHSGGVVSVHLPLPALQVVAGDSHACALLINGTVRCWGSNTHCQLGYGHNRSVS